MHTFLPYADFSQSVAVLDDKRLNRQRSDIAAILRHLSEPDKHKFSSVHTMWRGNEQHLIRLGMLTCFEWQSRGGSDEILTKLISFQRHPEFEGHDEAPEWLGDEKFHRSHQSYLIRSLPSHYKELWPDVSDGEALIWPRSPNRKRISNEERQRVAMIKRVARAYEAQVKAIAEFSRLLEEVKPLSEEEKSIIWPKEDQDVS